MNHVDSSSIREIPVIQKYLDISAALTPPDDSFESLQSGLVDYLEFGRDFGPRELRNQR